MSAPYIHHESLHDTNTCSELVRILYGLLQPDSVVDIGCGSGNFLKAFSDLGVSRILGYDGNWVSPKQRRQFFQSVRRLFPLPVA